MKKIYLTAIFALSGFLFVSHRDSSGDALSELSNWMERMERLADKMDNIEKDIDSLKNTIESFERREKTLATFAARIEALEQMESGQTMNTLKEGLSELRKVVEDQQVITAVLEKKYQEAQRPLEPIKTAIEEQKEVISKLVARIDAQDKRIELMSDSVNKKMMPLAELTKEIDEKMASISRLSDIINNLEKRGDDMEKALISGLPSLSGASGTSTAETPVSEGEKKFSIADVLKAQGFQETGGGFFVRDVKFKSFGSSVEVSGEVMNDSEENYNVADFRIFVYDDKDTLLRSQDFSVKGINKGNVKPFKEIISGVKVSEAVKYAVTFGRDIRPDQITNPTAIKGEETGLNVLGEGLEKVETAPKIEEGFEDIGNNFYVRNLNIKKFGSSCEITGELKSLSDKYFSIAPFHIKIFNNQKDLIWEQDFSVKGIRGGAIKGFSEFLTGVEPEDVGSYEIRSKG